MDADDLAKVWNGIDKLARRAGDPKDLVSVLSARGSQHSYAKASSEVRPAAAPCLLCARADAQWFLTARPVGELSSRQHHTHRAARWMVCCPLDLA